MGSKPLEYWIALVVGMMIVVQQHREKPWLARVFIAAISGGIGYSAAPELAAWAGRSETLAVMFLTAFGYALIDVATSIVADRATIREIIVKRLGGGK